MEAILLIADNNVRRRSLLRRCFSGSDFLVMTVASALDCLTVLPALRPDVLVIEIGIPWGGGDGVISLLSEGMPIGRKPVVLVMGHAPVETLSARSGVIAHNCFQEPVSGECLLDRIGVELATKVG